MLLRVPGSDCKEIGEVKKMSTPEDPLKHEYMLNQKWAVTRMIQSYNSDDKLAYVHGFDAGIDLLCAKAKVSDPAIARSIRQLADKMAEETAESLRSSLRDNRCIILAQTFYRTRLAYHSSANRMGVPRVRF